MVRSLVNALRGLTARRAIEREMQDEMAQHLERSTQRLIARGMRPAEARREARREFGNVGVIQEEGRDARGGRWVEALGGDLRYAWRQWRRAPALTATMIVVLSIGIGANSTLFSLVRGLVAKPAPGIRPDAALVRLRGLTEWPGAARRGTRGLSYPEVEAYAARTDLFASVAVSTTGNAVLHLGGASEGTVGATVKYVSPSYFPALGVRPVLGQALPVSGGHPATDPPPMVAVMSHDLWQRRFAGAPEVVGKTIRVNDVPVTIAGIAPPLFEGETVSRTRIALFMPLAAWRTIEREERGAFATRGLMHFVAIARLKPGVAMAMADAAVRGIPAATAPERSLLPKGVLPAVDVVPLRGTNDNPRNSEEILAASAVLGALALIILGITCTNVSSLLVGTAVARRREIAVRLSLGASRMRLVRQLLTESVLLAVAGAAGGLLTLLWLTRLIGERFAFADLTPDLATTAFSFAFAIGTGLVFGIVPALHGTRVSVDAVLKESASGITTRARKQRAFVVAQIALTQPLLVGLVAAIAVIGAEGSGRAALPAADRIVSVSFSTWSMGGSRSRLSTTMDALRARIATIPGVEGIVPQQVGYAVTELVVHPDDRGNLPRAAEPFKAALQPVAPGTMALEQVPILRGRELARADSGAAPNPIVIASDLAATLWGNTDPLGKRFLRRDQGGQLTQETHVVVGVVDAAVAGASDRGSGVRTYTLASGIPEGFLVRTSGPAVDVMRAIAAVAHSEAPGLPIVAMETLRGIEEAQRAEMIQATVGAGAGGLLALLLSAIGLYAVVALAVAQRTREIGIRIALGSGSAQVSTLFVAGAVRLGAIGVAIGLPVGLIALRLVRSEIRMPGANDGAIALAVAATVIGATALAAWIPARRAGRVDPLVALRSE